MHETHTSQGNKKPFAFFWYFLYMKVFLLAAKISEKLLKNNTIQNQNYTILRKTTHAFHHQHHQNYTNYKIKLLYN